MQSTSRPRSSVIQLWERQHPARRVFAGFVALNLLGWGLLMLPVAKQGPGGSSWIEALFTAVSAACVTGLTVVDTALHWTPFGQVVILLLIQLGGLGVMVFASLIGIFVMGRLTLGSRLTTAQEAHAEGPGTVRTLVLSILRIALTIEGVVAVALFLRFWLGRGEDPLHSLWLGVFHAVSSFNNAGFALFSDNLMGFVDDPSILLPLALSTIVGGLGFPVIVQLLKHGLRGRRYSMHTWLVLTGTAVLLAVGTAAIALLEWSNPGSLGAHPTGVRLLEAFFHSVQTRTAGFNALDIGAFEPETLLVMDVLMFIGGGPAGTAGGIKITTFGVLAAIIIAEVRGDPTVTLFGKRLSRAVHREAITVALLAVGLCFAATVAIMVLTDFDHDRVLFEVISAFGTVGLSTGITASVGTPSQLILVLLMFVGRVGPITVATALALRPRRLAFELPKERPIIG
ncbi:TrkH family potassium uptake protein [Agrococcus sp. HG114]|uniref:TrkH family potassium uptake protein n=1 Tax=Agrococcus sp. HG114 TaxID=2969757 RepID=UPI00215AECBD|nr:potassium transporter TrkG [Agrococcus sp. HG114]MCR8670112.1 TrkH family potassium uptake protein [Agrococcus sp. HG114]